jgi:hypothetical protein
LTWQNGDPISAQTFARLNAGSGNRAADLRGTALAAAITSPHGGFRTEFRGETNVSAEQARA